LTKEQIEIVYDELERLADVIIRDKDYFLRVLFV